MSNLGVAAARILLDAQPQTRMIMPPIPSIFQPWRRSLDANQDPLLQPFQLKQLVFRNRIMSTSHAIGYGKDGMPADAYQAYHEEKARGGIGLTMFGGSSNVSPDSGSVFNQLNLGTDAVIPFLEGMAKRVHRHGAAVMCQLTHLGGRSHWRADRWLPTIAPSRFREPSHRGFTRAMDHADIQRVVHDFGQAARRCKEGGLDGLELHVHNHLIGQFWSPEINKREDEFGGSLENRCRFGIMALEEVRRQVGDDYPVGLRMAVGEGREEGMTSADYAEIAQLYDRSGLVDFFNLTFGRIDTHLGLANYMPGMHVGLAPQLRHVAAMKGMLSKPIFHAARINDMATARYAITDGLLDMVGMTRAHIADPQIGKKLAAGQEDRIRPCVGATYCSWHRRCIHNPSIGNETIMPIDLTPTETPRRVTVIGAGPGGLEAARVAAARGHKVTIFEAGAKAGGQFLLATRAPRRRDLIGIIDWRVSELEKLGVEIHYNTFAEAEDIRATDPDVVIVATGGIPDAMEDAVKADVPPETVWDLLEDTREGSGDILLYDALGTITGASVAEMLAEAGQRLTVVTPDEQFGKEMSYLERPHVMKSLYKAGVTIIPDQRLIATEKRGNRIAAIFQNELTEEESTIECDRLILDHGTIPIDSVFQDLRNESRNSGVHDPEDLASIRMPEPTEKSGFDLFRIGDAVSSRDIYAAILEANRISRAI